MTSQSRTIFLLALSAHAVVSISLGRPSADTAAGVWLGMFHFAYGAAVLLFFGAAVVERWMSWSGHAERLLGAIVVATSAWIVIGEGLGLAGHLRFVPAALAIDASGVLGTFILPREVPSRPPPSRSDFGGPLVVLLLVVLRFAVPWGGDVEKWLLGPITNPDSIEVYSFVPLHAVAQGDLDIPYMYPFMMHPFLPVAWVVGPAAFFLPLEGTDFFNLFVTWPAVGIMFLAFYVAARRAGVSAWSACAVLAVFAAQKFLHLRIMHGFSGTDQWMTACLLAATAFLLGALREGDRLRWILAGAGVGLAVGWKPDAVVYLPPFLALAFLSPSPRRKRWVIFFASAAVVGGYGYLRNWVWTGNPIFPYPVRLGRITLFEGYETGAYRSSTPGGPFVRTFLSIFLNWWEFTQWATAAVLGGWILYSIIALRKRERGRFFLVLYPFLLFFFMKFLHPEERDRRLYYALWAAGIPFGLLLDRLGVRDACAAIGRRLRDETIGRPPSIPWRRVGLVASATCLAVVFLAMPSVVRRYRTDWGDRIAEEGRATYGEERVALWRAVAYASRPEGETVALAGLRYRYPFIGPRARNFVFFLPRAGVRPPIDWGWGRPPEFPHEWTPDTTTLPARLDAFGVTLLVTKAGTPEDEWARAAGLERIAETKLGSVYRKVD